MDTIKPSSGSFSLTTRAVTYCLVVPVDCRNPTSRCINGWRFAASSCQLLTSSIIVHRTISPRVSLDRVLAAINTPPIRSAHQALPANYATEATEVVGTFQRQSKQTLSRRLVQ